jgi:hypothetical protein
MPKEKRLREPTRGRVAEGKGTNVRESMSEASDGQRTAVLMTGEIIDALWSIQASMLATSPSAPTPAMLRQFCDEHATRLYRRTRLLQEKPELQSMSSEVHVTPAVAN